MINSRVRIAFVALLFCVGVGSTYTVFAASTMVLKLDNTQMGKDPFKGDKWIYKVTNEAQGGTCTPSNETNCNNIVVKDGESVTVQLTNPSKLGLGVVSVTAVSAPPIQDSRTKYWCRFELSSSITIDWPQSGTAKVAIQNNVHQPKLLPLGSGVISGSKACYSKKPTS